MKARPERALLSAAPLQDQFGSEARLGARFDGLAPERMEPRVREDLERALRQY